MTTKNNEKSDSSWRAGLFLTLALLLILIFSLTTRAYAADSPENGAASGDAASGEAVATATPIPTPTPTPPPPGKAKLRLMYTTDIHGQITGMDYQRQTQVVRGLDRLSTMMTRARDEMSNRNCMLFDIGDNYHDYTSGFIYNKDPYEIQPVYKALASLKYDAITLGNHEFDNGLDYVTEQLNGSGLMDKVVLSNVTTKYSGEYVFGKENRIIEKEVIDENGNARIVKIGVFGATPPTMSTRTEKVTTALDTLSFYDTAAKEVPKLKEMGADVIIALAHTGVGTENPSPNASNAGYAMTKVDGLDVILGGHEHIYFPSDSYSYLPGVDTRTWLVNGTRFLVMRDSARSLGIVDLNLSFDSTGKVRIDSSSYDIRRVTASTPADPAITSFMDEWGPVITEASAQKISSIGDNRWTTYLATLTGNPILKTVQNAQRAYAYQYIKKEVPEYQDLPIICATRYGLYGNESGQEYGDVTGTITAAGITNFARYRQYTYVYEITGAQLKEWMEWSAAAYQKPGTSAQSQWDDPIIGNYVRSRYGDSLIINDSLREWNSFFFFGGVEYTIDVSQPPRYSKQGNKISDSRRITSLTFNGQPVTDDMEFAIASDQLLSAMQVEATKGVTTNKIAAEKKLLQNVVTDYLKSLAQLPTVDMGEDTCWDLKLPANYRFIMLTGDKGDDVVTQSPWFNRKVASSNGYSYYECISPTRSEADTKPPSISLIPSAYETSDSPVTIRVMANDVSGTPEMKFTAGTRSADDENWYNVYAYQDVSNNEFTVTESGIYTVFVRDGAGNAAVQSIAITNIDPDVLNTPTIDKVDNNDSVVTGNAQVGATINVAIGDEVYQDKVDGDGFYMVEIPVQKARTIIRCYVSDSKGHASPEVSTRVRRVGPNKPSGSAQNNSYYVKGNTNDGSNVKMFAVIEDDVYVSKKLGTGYYKKCKRYNDSKTIKKVSITISKTGSYSIQIPHQSPGDKIKVYTIDSFGRVSAVKVVTVARKTYEPVACYATYSTEKAVFGRIREGKKGVVQVYYADGKKGGSAYSDKNGYFHVTVDRVLTAGEKLTLYAKYTVESTSKSHPASMTVEDIADADIGDDIRVRRVTTADVAVTGNTDYKNGIVSVCYNGTYRMKKANDEGLFKIRLAQEPQIGDVLYVLVRTHNGYFESCKRRKVIMGPPSKPVIEEVRMDADEVIVSHTQELKKMTLKVKKTLYTKPKVYYSKAKKRYYYTFDNINNLEEGVRIVAFATNEGGRTRSDPYRVP